MAWAPVPAGFVPIAIERGKSSLLSVTGPQSILAEAANTICPCGESNPITPVIASHFLNP
jgi:hypothetical protein